MNFKGQNKIIYQNEEILKFRVESYKYDDKEVIIDVEDWKKIKNHHWHYTLQRNEYFYIINSYGILLHRLLLNLNNSPKIFVDHKSGNTLDNRKVNLRKCTHTENSRNCRISKNNTSGCKGVYLDKKTRKWKSQLSLNGRRIYLGRYNNLKNAAKAYNDAALKYYKEFARICEN